MKKAVITTGSKQYLVKEGDVIKIELISDPGKTVSFQPLLVIDGDKTTVGTPIVESLKVTAEIVSENQMADKVTSIRYKAKKRVHTVRGHRQHNTVIKISKIA